MIELLAANWLWLVIGGALVWMHTGRGGCGMHRGHGDHGAGDATAGDATAKTPRPNDHDHAWKEQGNG